MRNSLIVCFFWIINFKILEIQEIYLFMFFSIRSSKSRTRFDLDDYIMIILKPIYDVKTLATMIYLLTSSINIIFLNKNKNKKEENN